MKTVADVSVKPASIREMPGAARGASRTRLQGGRPDADWLKSTPLLPKPKANSIAPRGRLGFCGTFCDYPYLDRDPSVACRAQPGDGSQSGE